MTPPPVRYAALAADYDGTLAQHGRVDGPTLAALERWQASGRKLILVTGRRLDELAEVFGRLDLFDRIVAENGALLYTPAGGKLRLLADPPPQDFVEELKRRGVSQIAVGRVIVAAWEPHSTAVVDTIRELNLPLHVILNKRAVMVLPLGTDKATGLSAALEELGISPGETVGIGDAENDLPFLKACGYAAAVANALPSLQEQVDYVASQDHGAGVVELIEQLLVDRPPIALSR